MPTDRVDFFLGKLAGRDAMRAALNWYRSVPLTSPSRLAKVTEPTMYDLTANWVTGPYRYEILDGVSHWDSRGVHE